MEGKWAHARCQILLIRTVSKLAKKLGLTAVSQFFDISSAYYSAVSALISWRLKISEDDSLPDLSTDSVLMFDESTQNMLTGDGMLDSWADNNEKLQLLDMLADAHRGSWFVVRGCDEK